MFAPWDSVAAILSPQGAPKKNLNLFSWQLISMRIGSVLWKSILVFSSPSKAPVFIAKENIADCPGGEIPGAGLRRGDYLDQDRPADNWHSSELRYPLAHTRAPLASAQPQSVKTSFALEIQAVSTNISCLRVCVCTLKQLELVFVQICFNLQSKHFESDFYQRAQRLGRLASDGGGEHARQEEADQL